MEKLHRAFDMNPSPNDKEREVLAEACGMTYKQVSDSDSDCNCKCEGWC